MKNNYAVAVLAVLALCLMGCDDTQVGLANKTPTANSSPSPVVQGSPMFKRPAIASPKLDNRSVAANLQFSLQLFQQISLAQSKMDGQRNIFVSPSSVAIALAMVYNGANGETQQAIAKTLAAQKLSVNDLNQFYRSLQQLLMSDPSVELNIANSLWARQDIQFQAMFLQTAQDLYGAEIKSLNFADPNTVNVINSWVKQSTKDKIEKIIDRIEPDSLLFLINAVYFKGKWTNPFNMGQTMTKPFTLANGTKVEHSAMLQAGDFLYYETPTFQAVRLPYGSGRFGMEIFLPKSNSSLQAFQKSLTADNWRLWSSSMSMQEGLVQLPRFKMDYEIELKNILQDMGMAIAFDPKQADFSKISAVPNYINDVKHKTFVEVNEEGTEAAAVTSIGMRATSAMPDQKPPFQMIVDRPFFLAISDRQTKTILFMGSIQNPEQK